MSKKSLKKHNKKLCKKAERLEITSKKVMKSTPIADRLIMESQHKQRARSAKTFISTISFEDGCRQSRTGKGDIIKAESRKAEYRKEDNLHKIIKTKFHFIPPKKHYEN